MTVKRPGKRKQPQKSATAVLEPPDLRSDSTESGSSSRCDGSRTAPDLQYEIMRRHRLDMSMAAIARETHCDERTVKAVISNWGTTAHTLRLQAHRPQVVDNLILGMSEAAKRGKLDSILNLSHTLGITEAPKNQQVSVGVQVVLNGGTVPAELGLSPAKPVANVSESGETLAIQAQSSDVNISALIGQTDTAPQHVQAQGDSAEAASSQIIKANQGNGEAAA